MLFAPSRNVVTLPWVIPDQPAWTCPGRAVEALAVDLRERIASLMGLARADLA